MPPTGVIPDTKRAASAGDLGVLADPVVAVQAARVGRRVLGTCRADVRRPGPLAEPPAPRGKAWKSF